MKDPQIFEVSSHGFQICFWSTITSSFNWSLSFQHNLGRFTILFTSLCLRLGREGSYTQMFRKSQWVTCTWVWRWVSWCRSIGLVGKGEPVQPKCLQMRKQTLRKVHYHVYLDEMQPLNQMLPETKHPDLTSKVWPQKCHLTSSQKKKQQKNDNASFE